MGDRLKNARIAAGYSSASAAAKAHGWRVSTYIAHENGQNDFDPDRAEIYARAFKTAGEWLVFGKEAPPASIDAQLRSLPPNEAKRLFEKFSAMIEGVKVVGKIK